MPKVVSIIVPVHNERENLQRFHTKLCEAIWRLPYDFEILIVDDSSTDGTATLVRGMAKRDHRLRLLSLSRHFGKEVALTAGINHARGDAAVLIDAGMQHPVELIEELTKRWEKGARMVIGVREGGNVGGWARTIGSRLYYRIIPLLSDIEVVPRSTDYRLIDRHVIDAFNRFHERNRMTRSLLDWLGSEREYVPFYAQSRSVDSPGYATLQPLRLTFTTFMSHSLFPLRIAGYLGMIITLAAGTLGLVIFATKYLGTNQFGLTGSAILTTVNVFLMGIVLVCLGLIGLRITSIRYQSMANPPYEVMPDPAEGADDYGATRFQSLHEVHKASRRRFHFARQFPPAAYTS